MLEKQIQKKITDYCKQQGWIVFNSTKWNIVWIADLIIFTWNNEVFFCEVKRPRWRQSEIQKYRQKEFETKGYNWLVVYSFDDFSQFVKLKYLQLLK